MHDDPRLGLQWPLPVAVISEKDQKFALLDRSRARAQAAHDSFEANIEESD